MSRELRALSIYGKSRANGEAVESSIDLNKKMCMTFDVIVALSGSFVNEAVVLLV